MQRDALVNLHLPITKAKPASAFALVEVFDDPDEILDAWDELDRLVPCSIYQTRAWLMPWIKTLGRKARIKPLFIVARGA